MDPEREGDAPSLTPSLNERRLSFNQFEGGREDLKEPLQLDRLKLKCWRKKTWSSSQSHCESPASHSRTSEKILIIFNFLVLFPHRHIPEGEHMHEQRVLETASGWEDQLSLGPIEHDWVPLSPTESH